MTSTSHAPLVLALCLSRFIAAARVADDVLDSKSFPVRGTGLSLKAEEPEWWALPDGSLHALFRDNGRH